VIRITGGELRGRRLRVAPSIRPTTELARKAAFDILGPAIEGCRVLDAAAGSGAYGVEALSRGASEAVFVEADPRVRAILAGNLAELGLSSRSSIAGEAVARFARRGGPGFDVVFYDPPWEADGAGDLELLLSLVAPGGILFHERGDDLEPLPSRPADERRRYGRTRFLVYRSRV
jgi:16S rRNA (guanine966-N2)-methyltransferase